MLGACGVDALADAHAGHGAGQVNKNAINGRSRFPITCPGTEGAAIGSRLYEASPVSCGIPRGRELVASSGREVGRNAFSGEHPVLPRISVADEGY